MHHLSSSQPGGRQVNRSNASLLHASGASCGTGTFSEGAFGVWNGLLKMTADVPLAAVLRLTERWMGFFALDFGGGAILGSSNGLVNRLRKVLQRTFARFDGEGVKRIGAPGALF